MKVWKISLLLLIIVLGSCKAVDPNNNDLPDDDALFDMVGHLNTVDAAYKMTIDDEYLFVSDGLSRLSTYDAYVPWDMEFTSTLTVQPEEDDIIYESVRDQRNNLYCASGKAGLYIFNTSNPNTPSVLGFYNDIKGKSIDLDVDRDILVITDTNGWRIYSINNSNSLSLANTWTYYDKTPVSIRIKYPYLYVSNESNLEIYDITMVTNPVFVKSINIDFIRDMQIINNYLVGITKTEFFILNIEQPYMASIERIYTFDNPTAFSLKNQELLIATESMRLYYCTLQNPQNLIINGYKTFNNYIYNIDYRDDYYYICCGSLGIYSFQLNTPAPKLSVSSSD